MATPGTAATHRQEAAVQNLNLEVYLILCVGSPILSVANADDDVSCAEPKVRMVSNVINTHVFLFSNELWQRTAVVSQGPSVNPGAHLKEATGPHTLTSTSSPLGRSLNHFTIQVRPMWSPDCTTP